MNEALERVCVAIRPFRRAALFELAGEGHVSVFEQLVACILSTRTRDETTVAVAHRLFAAAPTPEAMSRLGRTRIDALIGESTFHEIKASQSLAGIRRPASSLVSGGSAPSRCRK